MGLVPTLRFPEFRDMGEWELEELGKNLNYLQPKKYLVCNSAYDDAYATPVLTAGKTFILGYTDETAGVFQKGLPVIIFDDFTTASKFVNFPFKAKSSAMKILVAKSEANIKFFFETMQMLKHEVGVHKRHWISVFSKLRVPIPLIEEQQKIADCLSSVDDLIAAQIQKIESLKAHKKGLMQQLFPAEDEKIPKLPPPPRVSGLVPTLRFPEFRDMGEWELEELGKNLNYLQPKKYLVCNSAYDDAYATPVLTAGKTFILGYTDETAGVFQKGLPVIIFDDFTTASKFVNFPFKAKSSAMKILVAKSEANIKFFFETMQMLKHEVGVHKRHWISVFSKLRVPIPLIEEQQKIADCLSSVDDLIAAQIQKIESLKAHKKGLMQQLFPMQPEQTGEIIQKASPL